MEAGVRLSGEWEERAKAVAGGELELKRALCLIKMEDLSVINCS